MARTRTRLRDHRRVVRGGLWSYDAASPRLTNVLGWQMIDKLDGDASLDATRVPLMISDEDRDGFVSGTARRHDVERMAQNSGPRAAEPSATSRLVRVNRRDRRVLSRMRRPARSKLGAELGRTPDRWILSAWSGVQMTAVGSNVFLDVDGAALAPRRGSDVKSRVGRVRRLPSGDRRDDGSVGRGTGLRRCLGLSLSTGHHPDRAHASRKRADARGGPAGAPDGHGRRHDMLLWFP